MNYKGFDLNLLIVFDALMSERHLTRASRRIGLSQPAMSAALARLRRVTGDELFVRSANGFSPTPRALDLSRPLRHALETVGQALEFADEFDHTTSQAVFTVALSDHPTHCLLPGLVARISSQAPSVDIRARSFRDRHDAIALLDNGSVDVAIGVSPGNEARILYEPLFEETFVGIARSDDVKIASFSDVEQFAAATHILVSPEADDQGVVDDALAKYGRTRRIGLTVATMYAVPELVLKTGYISTLMQGVVTTSNLSEQLAVFPLPIDLAPIGFHLLWHRRSDSHPAHKWFRTQIAMEAQFRN